MLMCAHAKGKHVGGHAKEIGHDLHTVPVNLFDLEFETYSNLKVARPINV